MEKGKKEKDSKESRRGWEREEGRGRKGEGGREVSRGGKAREGKERWWKLRGKRGR